MDKISCDICMDLIPLVQDGVASDDSVLAVKEHIKSCPQCRALYAVHPQTEIPSRKLEIKVKNKLQTFFAVLTCIGIFFGISLLVNEGILYMVLILPIIGACSYVIYHWSALWKIPPVLSIVFLIAHMISMLQGADFNLLGVVFWIVVITAFTELGTLIVGLMHFAFRKEN